MGRSKLSDAAFYVSRRVGRAAHDLEMIPDQARVGVGLAAGPLGRTLLHILVTRQRRVPARAEFVPLHLSLDGTFPPGLDTLASSLGLSLKVVDWPRDEAGACLPLEAALAAAGAGLNLSSVAVSDALDHRATLILGTLIKYGRLLNPELAWYEGIEPGPEAPRMLRPFGWIEEARILEVAGELGLARDAAEVELSDPGLSARREELGQFRIWLERLATLVPSLRMDFLTNICRSPTRIRSDYLA